MNLVNDGTYLAGNSSIKFTGNQNSTISGTSMPVFGIIEMAKTSNAKVLLGRNIGVGSSINFISGLLDLNNNNILLEPAAYLSGESETNRITGVGGFVEITQNMNAPASVNAGNLGATITSTADLGNVTVRRGHSVQSGTGLTTSINRYFDIQPTNNSNLNATLRLKYFDAELNGQNESILVIRQSNDNGSNWNNLSQTSRSANANYVEKTGIGSLALQTLANDVAPTAPVTGLVFNAVRKKPIEVQLTWTTATETNMNGFEVQRRLDNEADFIAMTFVNTIAPGGNSLLPLSYSYTDANAYTGISYYRLKIVDQGNNISYSEIKSVSGKGKKNLNLITLTDGGDESATAKVQSQASQASSKKITVGPNPNNGNFWFSVNGIDKETVATLYTIDGKQISQFRVLNLQQQKVGGVRTGIYLLKVPGFETQKIIVNGGGNATPQIIQVTNSLKN